MKITSEDFGTWPKCIVRKVAKDRRYEPKVETVSVHNMHKVHKAPELSKQNNVCRVHVVFTFGNTSSVHHRHQICSTRNSILCTDYMQYDMFYSVESIRFTLFGPFNFGSHWRWQNVYNISTHTHAHIQCLTGPFTLFIIAMDIPNCLSTLSTLFRNIRQQKRRNGIF